MEIRPISTSAQSVNSASTSGAQAQPKDEEAKKEQLIQEFEGGPAKEPVDVLGFMAQQSVAFVPAQAKSVNPAKYVDSESEKRIAGFMADFEEKVAQGLEAFAKEFPNMSKEAQTAAVLTKINNEA